MSYQTLKFHLTGASPLVMHNGQLADPLNEFAKALSKVTGKRKKTDADHQEVSRLEFLGGLYVDERGPCITGEMIEGLLISAAKKSKRGMEARAGIISEGTHSLAYDGPRDPKELADDPNFRLRCGVKIGKVKVMRTRPIFRRWACDVTVDFLPTQLNKSDISEMFVIGGQLCGLGDYRPKFGRFVAELVC